LGCGLNYFSKNGRITMNKNLIKKFAFLGPKLYSVQSGGNFVWAEASAGLRPIKNQLSWFLNSLLKQNAPDLHQERLLYCSFFGMDK